MSIVDHGSDWGLSEKSRKDVDRHKQKVDKAIREAARDLIAEESIITKKRSGTVKVPVRGVKDYSFVHGRGGKVGGVGTGPGKPGDVLGRKKRGEGQGQQKPGKPGTEKGQDYLEVEVDIDYLLKIMFEDLGLPFIEEKNKIQKLVISGYKVENIAKTGKYPLIHKKITIGESIKRAMGDVYEIINETDCDEDTAKRAYIQATYDINKSIEIVRANEVDTNIDPDDFMNIDDDDLRFRQVNEEQIPVSNAVIIFMIDTSGSMDTQKKYLARSMAFWMYEFIKSKYNHVEVRFITHTTEAKLVDEDEFFKRGESGGTACHTAFDLAEHLIDTEYSPDEYNVYVTHFSDGEDFNPGETAQSINRLFNKKVNMISYCEIQPSTGYTYMYGMPMLLDALKKAFSLAKTHSTYDFYRSTSSKLYAGVVKSKDHIYPFLQHVLFKE